ncbi:nucleoside diphosphate kinase regulator [Ferrovibrio sp.]|uniref:nucleoside diphosphate kinase regulator n=1 Tax=Ferrovibrio sp. TaxID=1917215 RepID=UPI0025C33C6C|nr:nucleoside diphosphate kinase regulator [Ferrovibrio sp.]MBX3453537.1 nucleoside diphosphate kinase regulator [Ferrovibrio sp.]
MSFLHPRPAIIVTEPDFERLFALAQSLKPRQPNVADMLDSELNRASLVPPQSVPADVATMGSHLVFGYEHSRKPHWLSLVWPDEADLESAKISVGTPVGAALIGLREGQSIAWSMPSGQRRAITLHKVAYQPEREGRYDV